jgi:hypothetical protein
LGTAVELIFEKLKDSHSIWTLPEQIYIEQKIKKIIKKSKISYNEIKSILNDKKIIKTLQEFFDYFFRFLLLC